MAWDRDISFELEQLFSIVIRPTTPLRQYLNKNTITSKARLWARDTIILMLKNPLNTLFKMADILATVLLDNIDTRFSDERIRNALIVALMFLSDCFRYSHDDQRSRDAARLLHIMSPTDPEAHMRLGMTLATLNDSSEAMEPFFHYCVFLANRKVPVDHDEAVIVSKFVKSVVSIKRRNEPYTEQPTVRTVFFRAFIDMLWSILSEDLNTCTQKSQNEQLWDSFKCILDEGMAEDDTLHLVGSLIFTHHRVSPRSGSDQSLLPQRELCDFIVGKILRMMSRSLLYAFQEMNATLRARRKNRRRAMQKKRKHDGTCNPSHSALSIGFDILNNVVDLNKVAPSLGGLSSLAQYWREARFAPSPTADISPLARTLHALQSLLDQMEIIEELTSTRPVTSFILDRIVSDTHDRIPAMPEDVKLSYLMPCIDYGMFQTIALPEVPLPLLFKKGENGIFRQTLKTLGTDSYESLVTASARRHLGAFSTLIAREVPENNCKLEKKAACTLVALTVRKHRITTLVTNLAKVGGGKVALMSLESGSNSNKERPGDNPTYSNGLCSPAQHREIEVENDDSLHEQVTESQLALQVRKRRRVLGNCTAYVGESSAAGSFANFSNEERHGTGEQQLRRSRDHRLSTSSPTFKQGTCHQAAESRGTRTLSRMISHSAILSQGSLQLDFAQTPQMSNHPPKPEIEQNSSMRLYILLRNLLYPPEAKVFSTPSGLEGPAYWRNAPKGDFAEDIFLSQPVSSDS